MGFVFPEVILRKVVEFGIKDLRSNKAAFDDLFDTFTKDELSDDYGSAYKDEIWTWFSTTKIPVVQAWSFNAQIVPCISIHLANETEDESKAALNDLAGIFDEESETGTGVFTVMVDLGIHANRGGDHVLWLYYVMAYILFKYKPMAHRLGLKLGTFSASDYSKNSEYMANNIWTRWVRFRCTTQNFWAADPLSEAEAVSLDASLDNEPASEVAASLDVDIDEIDTTANGGLIAGRVGDEDDEDNTTI